MGEWSAFHRLEGVHGARPLGHGLYLGGDLEDIRRAGPCRRAAARAATSAGVRAPGMCDVRRATCNVRRATCDVRRATCDVGAGLMSERTAFAAHGAKRARVSPVIARLTRAASLPTHRQRAREHVERREAAPPPAGPQPLQLQVVHGHAAWAAGQLEGEIRAGAWLWDAGAAHNFILGGDHSTAWARAYQHCMQARPQAAE